MSDLHYDVRLDLTTGAETFASSTTVTFKCPDPGAATFIEFIGPSVDRAELNGRSLPSSAFDGGRIQLESLGAENRLEVIATARYMRDGTGLHRFKDPVDGRLYLHTQFESNDAHRVYACFDQPDLKATFNFTVAAPEDWVVVSNTTPSSHEEGVWVFPTTKLISTYITAVVTGHYASWQDKHGDIPLGLYCRQSLAQYLDTPEIFEVTKQGLDFFAQRFGYLYPFDKYDQLFVPEFSAGAMENAACVTHSERMVYRSRVTEASRLSRAETILHEMAHMWFGDLVTMRWFNDLWLNESFATYMAYVSMDNATRFDEAWLDFATRMKARAKAQDQLPTTHPIVADIPDVEAVHLNFDSITYEKGASVLKQLVSWVGEEAFFKGINLYFRRHEYGNTELPDFLNPLVEASGRDLNAWARVWLETAGVNTIGGELEVEDGRIKKAALHQTAPPSHPTLRPHRLRVGLYEVEGSELKRRKAVELDVDGELTPVDELTGETAPDLMLVNDGDLTYTKLRLDARSIKTLTTHLAGLGDPLARALAWAALWDMVRDAHLRARDYVQIALNNIDVETDAVMTMSLINLMFSAVDVYGDPQNRAGLREDLAAGSRSRALGAEKGSDRQLLWTKSFIDAARRPEDVEWVRGLMDGSTVLEGLKVDFAIRWSALTALARIGAVGAGEIAAELSQDPTEEGRRAAVAARAARPLAEAKEEAWSAVTNGDEVSLAMKRAFAAGFHGPDQEALLQPYVERFFDQLLPVWDSHDIDEGLMFVRAMYPSTIVREDVIELVEEVLSGELPGPVRRALMEAQDGTARELRARRFDASAAREAVAQE
jgi:aminopeptidase N